MKNIKKNPVLHWKQAIIGSNWIAATAEGFYQVVPTGGRACALTWTLSWFPLHKPKEHLGSFASVTDAQRAAGDHAGDN